MKRTFPVIVVGALLLCAWQSPPQPPKPQVDAFEALLDAKATDQAFKLASDRMREEDIARAKVWDAIASNPDHTVAHRRAAVFQLFRRFVQPLHSLNEFAEVFEHHRWLRREDISKVTVLAGWIPVDFGVGPPASVFAIRVLPEGDNAPAAIYIRVHGDVSEEDLWRVLNGNDRVIGQRWVAQCVWADETLLAPPKVDATK